MHIQSTRITIYGFLCILWGPLAGCSRGDVGAPCNHGVLEPPSSAVVTYPSKSCNDLICIYNDEVEPIRDSCTIGDDSSCNPDGGSTFECVEDALGAPTCRLTSQYVLENSMCSKQCESDSDCADAPGRRTLAETTSCQSNFKCAIVQSLGEFCCQKLCICADELDVAYSRELELACDAGEQDGCCVPPPTQDDEDFVKPDACGPRA